MRTFRLVMNRKASSFDVEIAVKGYVQPAGDGLDDFCWSS